MVPFVQFKNVEDTHGGMLLLVKTNTPSWVFFTSQNVSYYSMITLGPLLERNFIAASLKQLSFSNGNLLRYSHVRFMKQLTKRLGVFSTEKVSTRNQEKLGGDRRDKRRDDEEEGLIFKLIKPSDVLP